MTSVVTSATRPIFTAHGPPVPGMAGRDVGSASGGGLMGEVSGFLGSIGSKLKSALPYAAIGGAAGAMFPVIPGGPVGGAAIGAAVGLLAPSGRLKQVLLGAGSGAILGMMVPVIPGGPIGGALIGAALSWFF